MKPPPRQRTQSNRYQGFESAPRRTEKPVWLRTQQRRLLRALKRLKRTSSVDRDIDYTFLRKHVPARSTSEIHSLVESLKNKAISCASRELKRNEWAERKDRKPIEVWTHMASAVAGTLEESISTAFSQMLIVSSTEPRTLRNCDPPQDPRPAKDRPALRTVPCRPMPRGPALGQRCGTNKVLPVQVVKTLAATVGPVVPPSTTTAVPSTSQCAPAAPPTPPLTSLPGAVKPSSVPAAMAKTSTPPSSSPHTPPSPSATTSLTLVPSPPPSSSATASDSRPQLSTPAAKLHSRCGRTSKYATKDCPRSFGVKGVVDFERIYHYLSTIHKPNEKYSLTPMESAILLDLLLSLPEELPLLDCNNLHKHLLQVYKCLVSPADSKITKEMFASLKGGQTGAAGRTDSAADKPDGSDSGSSGSTNPASGPGGPAVTEHCPPLNPFMIPLKLLRRR